jgi:hypothetical protein
MQSQPAYANVYPASLSFLDPEPTLDAELDDKSRAEARAELDYVAAPTVLLFWAVVVGFGIPALSHVLGGSEDFGVAAHLVGTIAFCVLFLVVVANVLVGLARGRNHGARFGTRLALAAAAGSLAQAFPAGLVPVVIVVLSCVVVPIVYLALLSRHLPDYALARFVWTQRESGSSGVAALYDKRAPLGARVAWALSSWALRSEIHRRTP